MEISQQLAEEQFLALARKCIAQQMTAADVVREMVEFYRSVRIEGADLDSDGDMLLFQWGTAAHLTLSEPTDLRNCADQELEFDSVECRYLDFTRQVFAESDAEDFDDAAIQMSLTLVFEPKQGKEESGNIWIDSPRGIDSKLKKHALNPLVASSLNLEPKRYVAVIQSCG